MYFNDVFKLATMEAIATSGSQLVASEVITRNELRQRMGYKPVEDQAADQLMNPNINPHENVPEEEMMPVEEEVPEEGYEEEGGGTTLADIRVMDIP